MVLKTWSEAQKIYKITSTRVSRAMFVPWPLRKAWSYWYIWVTNIVLIPLSFPMFIGMWTERFKEAVLGFLFFLLTAWLAWIVRTKALAKEFSDDYVTQGLAQYPFSTRWRYHHYALFLHELVEQGYSHEDVAKLSSFADIAKPPEAPAFQLSQYPSLIYLLGVFTPLVVNFITNSPRWKSGAAIFIIFGLQFVVMVFGVLPFWHSIVSHPQYQHLTLQRFLQWAERDIKEAQGLRNQRLRMEMPGSHGP